jgi:hypothetical protein
VVDIQVKNTYNSFLNPNPYYFYDLNNLDYIIICLAISGIYSAYLLNQCYPKAKILGLESHQTYDGRIVTKTPTIPGY